MRGSGEIDPGGVQRRAAEQEEGKHHRRIAPPGGQVEQHRRVAVFAQVEHAERDAPGEDKAGDGEDKAGDDVEDALNFAARRR
jgi:hypothetical protein